MGLTERLNSLALDYLGVRPARSSAYPYSMDDYLQWVSTAGAMLPMYGNGRGTLAQPNEEPPDGSFESLVQVAYRGNGVVFATELSRLMLFKEARFLFQRLRDGIPGDLFGSPELSVLESPWPGGTTGDLLGRMLLDADLAGTAIVARRRSQRDRLAMLRPDWTVLVGEDQHSQSVLGCAYYEGGIAAGKDPEVLMRDEVAVFTLMPDPLLRFRGIPWLVPVVNEVLGDRAITQHKLSYFRNGATVNQVVTFEKDVTPEVFDQFVDRFGKGHDNRRGQGFKTLFLGGGATFSRVGDSPKEIELKAVQGAGETRIAAAGNVPPIIVGLSEGLASATYCLPGDEPVWTLDGPRPIASVRAGDQVWATADGAMRPGVVTWQGMVGERLVYRVRTKNRILHATDNHPVLVRVPGHSRGGNASRSASVEWRAVGELRPGDEVVEPTRLPDAGGTLPSGIDPRLVQWLGAYVGDGSGVGTGAIRLAIPPTDRVRGHYESLTRDIFGIHVGHEPRGFRIHSVAASGLLSDMGFDGTASSKGIPGWVFRLPLDLRLRFLAGLIDTDGSIDRRGVGSLGFANRALVDQARMLALSCGVQASNVMYRRQSPDGLPNPGTKDGYDYWSFALTTGLGTVPTADPLYQRRLAERRDHPEGHDAERAGLDGMGFFAVRSVEPMGVEPVYDIEVAGDHSFVANGIAVHNSNYGMARRRFADLMARPAWRDAAGALQSIVPTPSDARLWYYDRDIPFLQEDVEDDARIRQMDASSLKLLIDAGFHPDSAVAAINAGDWRQLQHTGLYSVQLQPPNPDGPDPADPARALAGMLAPYLGQPAQPPMLPAKAEAVERAKRDLIDSGIPRPTNEQIAEHLGIAVRTLYDWKREAA